jgi:molybdopterin biosynthesis enzyme
MVDVLITTGGVSVGKYDLTKLALSDLGAEIFFERIRLKPGKPTVFARLKETAVFALPGNPVSAAVTFYLFVRPTLLGMQGAGCVSLTTGEALALSAFKATPERDAYLPAKLGTDNTGRLTASLTDYHGSSDFIGFASADALVTVKRGKRFETGDVVPVMFLF